MVKRRGRVLLDYFFEFQTEDKSLLSINGFQRISVCYLLFVVFRNYLYKYEYLKIVKILYI